MQTKSLTKIESFTTAAFALVLISMIATGCIEESSEQGFNSALTTRYLYVASGSCTAGGAAVSSGNATIAKFDVETGNFAGLVVDYNTFGMGDQPASIANFDSSRLLVAVENTNGRRVDIIDRDGSNLTTYILNATALSGILRHLVVLPDLSILVTKVTAIEKFSVAKTRILSGVNPFINAPASPCATSTTAMTSALALPNGKIVFTHGAATPNNITAVVASTGYTAPAHCLAGQAAPVTTALPTSSLYDPTSGKLLVAYGSATATSNLIYSYNINLTSGAISGAAAAYTDNTVVNGPTRMVRDATTGAVFVSNGSSALNNIEKFTLSSAGVLTKVGTLPFISNVYTRCVTSMEIGP